mmetsp:Transcript_70221/g.146344  ORF Transcript_70221/g.146344 Transcript_70221/m.146344 type:complete len:253 (-) Transcript_70221:923-1681(-)
MPAAARARLVCSRASAASFSFCAFSLAFFFFSADLLSLLSSSSAPGGSCLPKSDCPPTLAASSYACSENAGRADAPPAPFPRKCGGTYADGAAGAAAAEDCPPPPPPPPPPAAPPPAPGLAGRSGWTEGLAGRKETWYSSWGTVCSVTSEPSYLKILNPLSTRSRGKSVAVRKKREQGDHAQLVVPGAFTAAITFLRLLSQNSRFPEMFPNPPSITNRPCGAHATVLREPVPKSNTALHFMSNNVALAGMNP